MRDCTIVCVISRETKMMEHLRYSGFSVASISSREKIRQRFIEERNLYALLKMK